MLARVHIEHELSERAMQTREISGEYDEARARDLAGDLEIEPARASPERDVIARREVQLTRLTPTTHFHIGRLVAPVRNARMQQIRKAQHQLVEALLDVRETPFNRLQLAAQ